MPIDIGLLREESGNVEQVKQWQILRYATDATSDVDVLIATLQALQVERTNLLREVTKTRAKLRSMQRSIQNVVEKETMVLEMKQLKQVVIPELERNLDRVTMQLGQTLPRIANCVIQVDIDEASYPPVAINRPLVLKEPNEAVMDPLYCLRGYETVTPSGCTVLTGTGVSLARSLSNHALQFCRNHSVFKSFVPVILPSQLEVDLSTAHSIMGCSPMDCPCCCESVTIPTVPPWVAASLMHDKTKYFDRKLPIGQVLTTICSLGASIDKREVNRFKSFRKSSSRLHQCCQGERIELFSLVGNTISESNAMQREMVNTIVDYHHSLLLGDSLSSTKLQLRVVEPQHLLPCEASRVVVEGMLGKALITLGYVSNFTDYTTRATNTRMGGSHGYCHAVHGLMCSIPTSLEWVLQHSVVEYNNELGIAIPPALSLQVQEQLGMVPSKGALFLPFSRRKQVQKNGKVTRTELNNASEPSVIPASDSASGDSAYTSDPSTFERKPPVWTRPLTAEDIENERLSCPFDFLPIGQ